MTTTVQSLNTLPESMKPATLNLAGETRKETENMGPDTLNWMETFKLQDLGPAGFMKTHDLRHHYPPAK